MSAVPRASQILLVGQKIRQIRKSRHLTQADLASRIGDAQVAAHEIAFQVWNFLALSLDAIAIAGQAIVGRSLGAGDREGTRASAKRTSIPICGNVCANRL